jgi:hypothetical protein
MFAMNVDDLIVEALIFVHTVLNKRIDPVAGCVSELSELGGNRFLPLSHRRG